MKRISLTRGKYALVDDENYEWLSKLKWNCTKFGYASSHIYRERRHAYMHREILRAEPGQDVDHINHDKLDNRRSNLRLCSRAQNKANGKIHHDNKSGYKGVFWHPGDKRWMARITVNYKGIYLGEFKEIKDAARRYNEAALHFFGEFASLNKI